MKDNNKLEKIYENYRFLMLRVAYSVLHNNDEAEDVVQEIFLMLLKKNISFPEVPSDEARNLLALIAEHKAIDLYRKKKKDKTVYLENESIFEEHLSEEYSWVDKIVDEDEIAWKMQKLPPQYRQLLLLKYAFGYSVKDICKITGKRQETVRKTILRAKDKLFSVISSGEINKNDKRR